MEIRDDIPIPTELNMTHMVRQLKIGDSVLLPIKRNSIYEITEAAGLTGKYTSRKVEGGFRIWRTK